MSIIEEIAKLTTNNKILDFLSRRLNFLQNNLETEIISTQYADGATSEIKALMTFIKESNNV